MSRKHIVADARIKGNQQKGGLTDGKSKDRSNDQSGNGGSDHGESGGGGCGEGGRDVPETGCGRGESLI